MVVVRNMITMENISTISFEHRNMTKIIKLNSLQDEMNMYQNFQRMLYRQGSQDFN